MAMTLVKMPTSKKNLSLRVCKGHFATSHSHINYYIDVTIPKTRMSEAKEVAQELTAAYKYNQVIDTVLCLDGMEVVGACMANDLANAGCLNTNEHGSLYVVTPEHTSGSQLLFRENTVPMINGKHVLILLASVSTGYTAQAAIQAIRYYGGEVAGISAIFATLQEVDGIPVVHAFDTGDLPDYQSWDAHTCPFCREGRKIDALVNSHGYSSI